MDLTDEQWPVLEPLIGEMPRRADGRGRPWRSRRDILNGVRWILRTARLRARPGSGRERAWLGRGPTFAVKPPSPHNEGDPSLLLLLGPDTIAWPSAAIASRSVAMPVSLHPLTTADYVAVDPLLTAAYARSSSMLDDLDRYRQRQPDGWLLARLDGIPAGMGGAIAYGATARIGLMAVPPRVQRPGIGRAFMEHLLEWATCRGATTLPLYASPAEVPLYARLRFVTHGHTRAEPSP